MKGWQPIETAPQDGSIFLAWREEWGLPNFVHWLDDKSCGLTGWIVIGGWQRPCTESEAPTHWVALPIPPPPDIVWQENKAWYREKPNENAMCSRAGDRE